MLFNGPHFFLGFFLTKNLPLFKSAQISPGRGTKHTADITDFASSRLLNAFKINQMILKQYDFNQQKVWGLVQELKGGQDKKIKNISSNFLFPKSTENWYYSALLPTIL